MKKNAFIASMVALALVVVAVGLLAIPFGFASKVPYDYSGFEVIFHYGLRDGIDALGRNTPNARASVANIIALVFAALAVVSYAFNKKSTVLSLLGGICSGLAGLFFLSNELWIAVAYKNAQLVLGWMTYVVGVILVVASVGTIFHAVKALNEEKQVIETKQNYSYLKSNKKED